MYTRPLFRYNMQFFKLIIMKYTTRRPQGPATTGEKKTMKKPAAIATWTFGKEAAETAGALLLRKQDVLDAVEKGINAVELNPGVHSVGYSGHPNSDGVVELDAAIMDGRTFDVGSVAALKGFRRPISVARKVLEKSRHSMLAGEGARSFARSFGFMEEELLTEDEAEKYREWKEKQKGGLVPEEPLAGERSHDTVGLLVVDEEGQIAAGCSTSGLAYKHPGRVGDSPLVGSGLYADSAVGAAASTGDGDEILKFCFSFLVVELMHQGLTPQQAASGAIQRYLKQKKNDTNKDINVIALNTKGEIGAATLRTVFPYAVWTPENCTLNERTTETL